MSMFKRATRTVLHAIPGQSGYEIDTLGNVYSTCSKCGERRRLRPGRAGNGYLTVALHRKTFTIHKLMQMVFLPETVGSLVMNHRDGNKHNNRLDNLEAVTPSANNQHAWDTGLRKPNKKRNQ